MRLDVPRLAAAKRIEQAGESPRHARVGEQQSRPGRPRPRSGASLRQASRSGNTSAATSSRSGPASTTSRTSGAKCAMKAARSGPTLTQVPVASLKSSASRPSNSRPLAGSAGVVELQRVADLVKPFLVEGGRGQRRRAPIAGRNIGASEPRFELAVARHEFQLHAGQRQADIAGALGIPSCRPSAAGAVSVEPRLEMNMMRSPVVSDREALHRRRAHAARAPAPA